MAASYLEFHRGIQVFEFNGPAAQLGSRGRDVIRSILKDAACLNGPPEKPAAWQAAQDAVDYAIVVSADASNVANRVNSNGWYCRQLTQPRG